MSLTLLHSTAGSGCFDISSEMKFAGYKKKKDKPKTSTSTMSGEANAEEPSDVSEAQTCREAKTPKKLGMSNNEKKLVFNFMKNTFTKGPTGLRKEFMAMKRGNDFTKMTVFVENNKNGKNRYKAGHPDVGCLDKARVKLVNFPGGDYIHANYVQTPCSSKRFICTQAPMDVTCEDFWHMCLQEKVEVILMLCNLTEKGAKKCHEYYPASEGKTLIFGEYTIKCIISKILLLNNTPSKIRETTLEVTGNGQKLRTRHYHWIDWPDRGVPPPDMAVIQLLDKVKSTSFPIVVHCSAGIGRTGSVVLIQTILETIAAGQEVEQVDKMLARLRDQRNNSVQTDHQYLFVHMVMLNYFEGQKIFDANAKKHSDMFLNEYKKIVI